MNIIKKYKLEIIVFVAGAITMIVELAGSRVIAPYYGSSTYTWTGIIGVILASLSAGYYYGGRLADKNASYKNLSLLLVIAGSLILISNIFKDQILKTLPQSLEDIRLFSVIGSIILFAPASFILGTISPYSVRLKLNKLENSGSTVGNLYAISTVGSITGTFLSGFYLISFFGTTTILNLTALILLVLSLVSQPKAYWYLKIAMLSVLVISSLVFNYDKNYKTSMGYIDVDTEYSRVIIFDTTDKATGKRMRYFTQNKSSSSAMFLDSSELAFNYAKLYDLAQHYKPNFNKTLLLGGAAYSYPKYFLEKYPEATMDVVEIDPKVTDLAKKYFNLKDDERLKIYHEDARVFLNNNNTKYDVIYGDAFNALYSIPHHLTTVESIEKMSDSLSDDGLVILNLISALEGEKSLFFQAQYNTYKSVFPQVLVFKTTNTPDMYPQNITMVALKSPQSFSTKNESPYLSSLLNSLWNKEVKSNLPILTDELSPVEYYMNKLLAS